MRSGVDHSPGGELPFYRRDHVADVLQRLDLGSLELDAEAGLGGDDEIDVIERVPVGDVGGRGIGAQLDLRIIEDLAEDVGEGRVDIVGGHNASPWPWQPVRACAWPWLNCPPGPRQEKHESATEVAPAW